MASQSAAGQLEGTSASTSADSPAIATDLLADTWADKYGPLKHIALKYGPVIFDAVMSVGSCNIAIAGINRRIAGNNELQTYLGVLISALGRQTNFIMSLQGPGAKAKFDACKYEVEHMPPPIIVPESGSRIIRPS